MKQPHDVFTLDLLDKPKRGRPRKPNAMTDAQRAREYRARKRNAQTITEKPEAVTEFATGAYCAWFPWAKGCNLDELQKSGYNVRQWPADLAWTPFTDPSVRFT